MKEKLTLQADERKTAGKELKALASQSQLRSLSSLEQAGILMLSMGEEASAKVLRYLSREQIISISHAMARLNNVKLPMVSSVIGRFFDDYKEQSSRSEEHTSELQSRENLVCRLLLQKKNRSAFGTKTYILCDATPTFPGRDATS